MRNERSWRREQGQTIILVAISLVALLAMAALAIDVVTLFVARGEIERAADAAALAGAKAMADSGATTDSSLNGLAQVMATRVINSGGTNGILQQNLVAGRPPQLASSPTFDFTRGGNPTISVTLQQTNLPIFFARIWGTSLATVSATAVAEAYNPSGSQAILGQTVPIAPQCVKPWLLANRDPNGSGPLIDPNTGAVVPSTIVGTEFSLLSACLGQSCTDIIPPVSLPRPAPISAAQYLPALVGGGGNIGPACGAGGTAFQQSISGCDSVTYACGGTVENVQVDYSLPDPGRVGGEVENGVECLIHAAGLGEDQGQDTIDKTAFPAGPIQIRAGSSNPLIGAGSSITAGTVITTSSSIVTIPVIDTNVGIGITARVIGFLQAFIEHVDPADLGGSIEVRVAKVMVLNVSGCGSNVAGPPPGPISGGGVSPVPVRLIHQ